MRPFPENMPMSTDLSLQPLREKGLQASAGRYSYGAPRVSWAAGDKTRRLNIGSFCSIAAETQIYVGLQGRHTTDFISTYPIGMIFGQPAQRDVSSASEGNLDVTIGSDVWLGFRSVILAGVSIGHGAVIGTATVVSKDVPPYAIVAGAPARLVRNRFDDETIDLLLRTRWWDWTDEKLAAHLDMFFVKDFSKRLRHVNSES